jgi:hypothetical protein
MARRVPPVYLFPLLAYFAIGDKAFYRTCSRAAALNRSTQDRHGRVPLAGISLGSMPFECTNVMWFDLASSIA